MSGILAIKAEQSRRFNYMVDSVMGVLLRGVYCPGLDLVLGGTMQVDVGPEGLLHNRLLQHRQLLPQHAF